uniref:Gypsy retrotransposon integrase-like protein 1 n=1 Tax=Latimeria chalumnae TaxID=7897 RepID=H3B9V0_LATCH
MHSGYWQIEVTPEDRAKTAFITHEGLFQFKVMPFGLQNAPTTFQRLMNEVLCFAYLDDIIIFSSSFEEHLRDLGLRAHGLTVNVDKCAFLKQEMRFLGHIVMTEGIKPDPETLQVIAEYPHPCRVKDIQKFLGLCNWYSPFVKGMSELAEPLNHLRHRSCKWEWTEETERAFQDLKHQLCTAEVLHYPDFESPFFLQTDASDVGLGAVLYQEVGGEKRVVAYGSRMLSAAERRYHTTERECLAVVWVVRKYRPYLDSCHFMVIMDHNLLRWLQSMRDTAGKLAQWALLLQEFHFTTPHFIARAHRMAFRMRCPVGKNVSPELDLLPFSCLQLWEAQKLDEFCGLIVEYLMKESFQITPEGENWRVVAPASLRSKVLEYFHDAQTVGHMGRKKTVDRIRSKFFWSQLRQEVEEYVKLCPVCQKVKADNRKLPGLLMPNQLVAPWHTLTLDLMGPLPTSRHGNKYLLVVVDQYRMFPLRRAMGAVIARKVEQEIFCQWGAPKRILSDNGPQFATENWRAFCAAWGVGVDVIYTSLYHPQCNWTEQMNRTIKTILRTYVHGDQARWDKVLPRLGMTLCTMIQDSTGCSPARLKLGRELFLPLDRELQGQEVAESDVTCYEECLAQQLSDLYQLAKSTMEKAHVHQKKEYDKQHHGVGLQVGSLILRRSHPISSKSKGFSAKLARRWEGPFWVARQLSEVIYGLAHVET